MVDFDRSWWIGLVVVEVGNLSKEKVSRVYGKKNERGKREGRSRDSKLRKLC